MTRLGLSSAGLALADISLVLSAKPTDTVDEFGVARPFTAPLAPEARFVSVKNGSFQPPTARCAGSEEFAKGIPTLGGHSVTMARSRLINQSRLQQGFDRPTSSMRVKWRCGPVQHCNN